MSNPNIIKKIYFQCCLGNKNFFYYNIKFFALLYLLFVLPVALFFFQFEYFFYMTFRYRLSRNYNTAENIIQKIYILSFSTSFCTINISIVEVS